MDEVSILQKLLFGIGSNLGTHFIQKFIIQSKFLFNRPKRKLGDLESEVLKVMGSVKFAPGSSYTATIIAIRNINDSLIELAQANHLALARQFRIVFVLSQTEYYTVEMSILDIMQSLQSLDASILASIVRVICTELVNDQTVTQISSRDVFSSITKDVEKRSILSFQEKKQLKISLPNQEDQSPYEKDQHPLESRLKFGGVFCPLLSQIEFQQTVDEILMEMKEVGKKIAQGRCSPTHIVMSKIINIKLGDTDIFGKYLVITAGKTDKSNLIIPSQTPIVHFDGNEWTYWGDPQCIPSSETLSHWTIHEQLSISEGVCSDRPFLLHAHFSDIIAFSDRHRDKYLLPLGDQRLPNLDWIAHGTVELGDAIASAMLTNNTPVAVVKDHGPWFACQTLSEGLTRANRIIESLRL
jgi:ribulose-5-phosphate 4-epimerase/fuculose-1-phosphate aldolase